MISIIIIAFVSLIGLMVLHEFGHFLLAKLFGVRVEEFGIGYPPRLFGKKFGETFYSLNLLPFGAFVKIAGEAERVKDKRSFSSQPLSKRALIALGGVLSFWIIAAIIFSIVFNLGIRVAIGDEVDSGLVEPKVQIAEIAPKSPAQIAGLKVGDTILEVRDLNFKVREIKKVKELQEFTNLHKGEKIILKIERGKEIFEVEVIPRVSPPEGEGPIGLALVRTAIEKYPWQKAIWRGISTTGELSLKIVLGYFQAIKNVFKGLPSGVQMMGPVGIFHLTIQAAQFGLSYFLNFIALISIYLAIFNILPIPAVDGGKLLFLGIEAVRKRPVSQETEQKITAFCFGLLILIAIFVTIKDIARILKL